MLAAAAEIYFWDESGFRADAVHGKTWAERGKTPAVSWPGQRQGISAASAVNAKGAFWFSTYQGGLTGELLVELLKRLMYWHKKPLHLVVDGLPAQKNKVVKDYVASSEGRLTLHFLPGYAPDLNPDELVWSHAKRTAWRGNRCRRARNSRNASATNCRRSPMIQSWCARFSNIHLSPKFLTTG